MAWNGSEGAAKPQKVARKAKPSAWRGLLAAIIVIGGAAGVCLYFFGPATQGGSSSVKGKDKTAKIAEVTPDIAEPREPEPEVKDYANLDNIQLRRLPESETNNLSEAQVEYWKMYHPWPPPDKNQPKANRGKYRIFESRADNEIAFILDTEPGTLVLGNRSVGPDFERRFLKSIERPIIISEDDSEYEKELKRAVIAAKLELKAALDNGEDIVKIMDDARDELQRMGRFKAELEKEAIRALHREGTTADDVEDMVGALNIMLEQRGIGPIELNSMSRLAIKYQNLKNKEAEE